MEINYGSSPLIEDPYQVYHDNTLSGKGTKESPLKVQTKVENHTTNFNVTGASGTAYTNIGAASRIDAFLPISSVGTSYTFASIGGFKIAVYPSGEDSIRWTDNGGNDRIVESGDGSWVEGRGDVDSFTILKVGPTLWVVSAGSPNQND